MKEWLAFMAKDYPGRRQARRLGRRRLRRGADAGAGAEAVRRRPDPRERHEAGGEPEGLPHPKCCCPASRSTPAPTDFAPISQLQLMRFNGERWELFGDVISGDVGG